MCVCVCGCVCVCVCVGGGVGVWVEVLSECLFSGVCVFVVDSECMVLCLYVIVC